MHAQGGLGLQLHLVDALSEPPHLLLQTLHRGAQLLGLALRRKTVLRFSSGFLGTFQSVHRPQNLEKARSSGPGPSTFATLHLQLGDSFSGGRSTQLRHTYLLQALLAFRQPQTLAINIEHNKQAQKISYQCLPRNILGTAKHQLTQPMAKERITESRNPPPPPPPLLNKQTNTCPQRIEHLQLPR